jgi:type III secretory pathway component EscV
LRQEKNKSGKYFTQLRQLLEQHQDFQLQAYQCYLDYQHAQQTYQKTVMHLNESLSQTRDYEDAPEQIPLWIQSRSEEKNMKAAKQKLIQYQLMIQQLQPKISQVYGILFPGVNPVINANQLTAPNVLPLSAQAAAAGLTPAHLMSSTYDSATAA